MDYWIWELINVGVYVVVIGSFVIALYFDGAFNVNNLYRW